MINKIAVMTTVLILACIGLLLAVAFHFYGKTLTQATALAALTQQKEQAEFITQSQALSVGIFNQIAGATLNEQKSSQTASQQRQTVIKTVLATAPCAVVPVPAAANDSLLNHYNAVRQSSSNTHSGKPSGTVSAVVSSR